MFEKLLNLKAIVVLFLGIIPFTVGTDCDIINNSFSYIKGEVYNEIILDKYCCNAERFIKCTNSSEVSEIIINGQNLPDADFKNAFKVLAGLSSLTSLKITSNNIKNGIILPDEIGDISSLKTIVISGNVIEDKTHGNSTIPESIGNLTNLELLDLSNSNLIGPIPNSLSNLKQLQTLILNDNDLTGYIPYNLKDLDHLININLSNNINLKGYSPLFPNITNCYYNNTSLCSLKDDKCNSNNEGCSIQQIQETNKENGAPEISTFESEVNYKYKKSNGYGSIGLVLGAMGTIDIILYICMCLCCLGCFLKAKEKCDEIKEEVEIERLEKEEARLEAERQRLERERQEIEREQREREIIVQRERREREKEIQEMTRIETEKLNLEKIAHIKLERERLERERLVMLERERLDRERATRERLDREREDREREERNRDERERLERERIARERSERERNGELPETPTLVIATHKFDGDNYEHLDFEKDEFLYVTEWYCDREGWVYGHRKGNEVEKGIFPKAFIQIYDKNNINEADERNNLNEITPEYKELFRRKIEQVRSLDGMFFLTESVISMEVKRNSIFEDAYDVIMNKSPRVFNERLRIKYTDEAGIDVGGLLKDFFYQMSKEIGNPNYSLFKYSHSNSYELEINPESGIYNSYHLNYFRFIGRIIGLAILNGEYLPVTFTYPLYKKLLNKRLDFSDLKYVDSQMYQNLQQLRDNDGAEYLYLTFSVDTEDSFGNKKTIELKPNGADIDVTDANKNEYIDLMVDYKLNNNDDNEQLNALKQGLYEIIPQRINTILDAIDLKYLISGINDIDVDDWEKNTKYDGYKKNDETVVIFWKCVRRLSDENRRKLLIFATGNSQVPVTGFKDLQSNGELMPFKLKKDGTVDKLPVAHTCFNRIDLPPYTSKTVMRQKLLQAIDLGMGAFVVE